MRHDISQEHYFHLDANDLVDPIVMKLRDLKRPVKMTPTTVRIRFKKDHNYSVWETFDVVVYGNRMHSTSHEWICEHYINCGVYKETMPDWLATLVRGAYPGA